MFASVYFCPEVCALSLRWNMLKREDLNLDSCCGAICCSIINPPAEVDLRYVASALFS